MTLFVLSRRPQNAHLLFSGSLLHLLCEVITPDLEKECLIRELVNRVQNQRKEMDLQITDRIQIDLETTSEIVKEALNDFSEYLLGETQADSVNLNAESTSEMLDSTLNSENIRFGVKAV